MYLLYSLITAVGMVLLLPYFFLKSVGNNSSPAGGKYFHNLRERLGHLPPEFPRNTGAQGAIWIHAVSVGEALAGLPLARRLRERFPGHPLYVSTTTLTGQKLVRERMDFADGFLYFPLDWVGPIRRVLAAVRPAVVVVLETEIWPNFLRECRRAGVPVVFVNGRISERSYSRYRLLDGFLTRVLRDATWFLVQTPEDALRLGALGAPEERVTVGGNLKYDLAPPAATPLAAWLEEQVTRQERRPLVVAGSVAADEEEAVLAGFDYVQRHWRHALLVLAPRKPARFEAAARIAAQDGWTVVRRSRVKLDQPLDEYADLLLLDSVGELAGLYRLADVVFVGGSLVPVGGHNILEPAWFSKPPVFGPWMNNFREMAGQFLSAGAAVQVGTGEALGHAWMKLLENAELRERMGAAARALVERNRGATERAMERLAPLVEETGRRG